MTTALTATDLATRPAGQARVLLMPLDIELSLVTTGGLLEPRADWTQAAHHNLRAGLRAALGARRARLVEYGEPQDPLQLRAHQQIAKLHQAVGNSVLRHADRLGMQPLPTLRGRFDWTLGAEARALAGDSAAEYALFVYARDSHPGAGRGAAIVLAAAAGISVPGGELVAFASLVDLRSGRLAWFNRLMAPRGAAGTVADLRSPAGAARAARDLLKDLPL
jgi:hypothetical protein